MKRVASPIKRHGGKYYLAHKIIGLMPARAANPNAPKPSDSGWTHYCEPYYGGGQVLFAMDPTGISEVVNDLDDNLMAFWEVLKDETLFKEFQRHVVLTPLSEKVFQQSKVAVDSGKLTQLEKAIRMFVNCRQSRQALGESFVTLSKGRTRTGTNEQISAWFGAIDGLPDAVKRMRSVVLKCKNAVDVIKEEDATRTLFYLDPTYMTETRVSKDAYEHEMSDEDHEELLRTLALVEGRFLLSGYRSRLYDRYAEIYGWRRVDFQVDLKSSAKLTAGKKEIRTESVWMNYGE